MKLFKILLALLIVFSLSSCASLTEMKEIEDAVLVCALGFDRSGEHVKASFEIAFKSDETTILTAIGEDARDCIEKIEKSVPEKLIFSHCGAVVIGQSLTHKTTNTILCYLFTKDDFPLNCYVVSADNSYNLLNCKMPSYEPIGYSLSKLLSQKTEDTDSRIFSLYRNEEKLLPCFKAN
jgi:hypothetical protein